MERSPSSSPPLPRLPSPPPPAVRRLRKRKKTQKLRRSQSSERLEDEVHQVLVDDRPIVCAMDKTDMLRTTRLIMEALEIGLIICNRQFESFGPNRLLSFLNDILPTAYILNTSYWPLYQTADKKSLCICNIFNMTCNHTYSEATWLKIDEHLPERTVFKSPDNPHSVRFKDFKISVQRFTKPVFYEENNIMTKKFLKYYQVYLTLKANNGFDNYREIPIRNPEFSVEFKLNFIGAAYDFSNMVISLTPHPLFHKSYGYYFSKLLDFNNFTNRSMPNTYIVMTSDAPNFTIHLEDLNIRPVAPNADN